MATTISKLEVELTLDDKNFQMKVRGTKAALDAFKKSLGQADTKVKRHEKNVRSLGKTFRHTIVTFGLLKDAIRTAWRMSGGLVLGIVNVNAEFERLNILLKGMSKGTTEMERLTDAANQFQQVISLAKAAPFSVQELTKSWVKFRSVGIDPSTGSLKALTDAVAAFGGTGDILHRATIAVQQMAGKGVISMEELRQQMGEAVPQAMVLLARGMNMSVGQMVDAISQGQVVAKPALAKMFAEFDLTFGGAAIDLMDTYIGSLARLTTVWQLTLKEMGDASGLFEAVKDEVKLLIEQLDDPAVRRFGIDIATGMVKAFRVLVTAIRRSVGFLRDHAAMVWKVIAAWGAFKAMGIVKVLLASSVAVRGLTKAMGLLAAFGMAKMSGNVVKASLSLKLMTNIFKKLRIAMMRIPYLAVAGMVLSIAAAMWGWFKASESVNESLKTGMDHIKQYGEASEVLQVGLAKLENQAFQGRINANKEVLKAMEASLVHLKEIGADGEQQMEESIQNQRSRIAVWESELERSRKELDDAINGAARRASDSAQRDMMATFRLGLEEARNLARSADAELNLLHADNKVSNDERLKRRLVIWKKFQVAQIDFAEKGILEQHKKIIQATNALGGELDEASRKEWENKLAVATAFMLRIAKVAKEEGTRIATDIANIVRPTELMDASAKLLVTAAATMNRMLINSAGKIASLKAEMFDGMKVTEAFIAKVSAGLFGDVSKWTEPMKKAFRELVLAFREIDELGDKVKKKRSFESAMAAAKKTLAAATEEALIFAEAVDSGLNEVTGKRGRRFRTMMAGIIAKYGEASKEAKALLEIQKQLLDAGRDIDTNKKILDTRKEIDKLDVAAIQNLRDRFEKEQALFDLQWKAFLLENAQAKNIKELTLLYEQLRDKRSEAFEDSTPMARMLKEWEDTMGAMETAQANWMNSFVETLIDGVAEGKIAFADFAKSILKDLLRIYLRALIVRAVMSMFGGGVDAPVTTPGGSGFSGSFAKGGIMSSGGPIAQYARGGIATKPQIAVFGEGDQNEAFVPLPDGRSIPVSLGKHGGGDAPEVTVNVINESGVPLDAEQQGGLEFDGEGFVLDVVLRAVSRPGGFRDGMKGATS